MKRLNPMQIELLLECTEHKLNFDEIHRILGIDLSQDKWLQYLTDIEQINAQSLIKHLHPSDVMILVFKSKLNAIQRNSYINQIFTYPVLLYFLSLNLLSFVILSLIPSTYSSLQTLSTNHSTVPLKLLQFIIGLEWGALILILYALTQTRRFRYFEIYTSLYKHKTDNFITLWHSHVFVSNLHFLNCHSIPLHTTIEILCESASMIQRNIALNIQSKLEQGTPLQHAFEFLDQQLGFTLGIEDFEHKIDVRLERYLLILEKQIRYRLKRYANIFSAFVYAQIGLMVILVYSTLLYPLQILEQII